MSKFVAVIALLMFATCAAASDGLIKKQSTFGVKKTMDRLESIVKEKGFTVFARIDHAAGARKVDKELRPTELLIFGNPKVGTALMSSSQAIGIDLPIKVLAWKDAEGKVWIAYNDPAWMARRHAIADRGEVVEKMTKVLNGLTGAATGL